MKEFTNFSIAGLQAASLSMPVTAFNLIVINLFLMIEPWFDWGYFLMDIVMPFLGVSYALIISMLLTGEWKCYRKHYWRRLVLTILLGLALNVKMTLTMLLPTLAVLMIITKLCRFKKRSHLLFCSHVAGLATTIVAGLIGSYVWDLQGFLALSVVNICFIAMFGLSFDIYRLGRECGLFSEDME